MLSQDEKKMRAVVLLHLEKSGAMSSLDAEEARHLLETPEAEWPAELKEKLRPYMERLQEEAPN